MAIDNYGLSVEIASEYNLESDEVIFIQDLLEADDVMRECEKLERYKSPNHFYPMGVYDVETNLAYIYLEKLRLTNLVVGMDIESVVERLSAKKIICDSRVLTRRVVAFNWEVFD